MSLITATPAPLPPSLGGDAPPCRKCGGPRKWIKQGMMRLRAVCQPCRRARAARLRPPRKRSKYATECNRCGGPLKLYEFRGGQEKRCTACTADHRKGNRFAKKLGVGGYVPTVEQIATAAAAIKAENLATMRASMGGKHGEPGRPRVYRTVNYWDANLWDMEA